MVMNGDGEHLFAVLLADDILVELGDNFARRGNAVEERLGRAAAALFLFQDRLAQVDTLAADIDVARPLDERADVAVALATERAEGVLLRGAGATTPSTRILSCGHGHSLVFRVGRRIGYGEIRSRSCSKAADEM